MNLTIKSIPHTEQRYPTVGDYWEDAWGVHFRVSEMMDPRYEQLVIIHELVEYFLVKLQGVSLKAIDDFDVAFESNRTQGNLDEPGDDPSAPYFMQHQLATMVERLCALFFGVLWKEYEQAVYDLDQELSPPRREPG